MSSRAGGPSAGSFRTNTKVMNLVLSFVTEQKSSLVEFLQSGRVAYLILLGLLLALLGFLCFLAAFDSEEARQAPAGILNQLGGASSSKQFQAASFLLTGGLALVSITYLPALEVVF